LNYIKIVGLNLSDYSWKKLGKSFLGKFHLDYCIITHCKLSDESLNYLSNGLKKQVTIRRLDLSNNYLSDNSGYILARVLSAHSEGKDELIWMFGLRNEYPNQLMLDYGVYEISLANNHITDRAIFDLSEALHFNNWL